MMRWITVCAMSLCLALQPAPAQAGVIQLVKKCSRSLKMTVACIILERGFEKVVDLALGDLIALAFGRTEAIESKPSSASAADIEANGLAWSELKDFLVLVFDKDRPVDDAQARAAIAASCAANHLPVCTHLGIAAPHPTIDYCSKITVQRECESSMLCSWAGTHCSHSGRSTAPLAP